MLRERERELLEDPEIKELLAECIVSPEEEEQIEREGRII